jgi:4-azaleucine resistance transporter AzlC
MFAFAGRDRKIPVPYRTQPDSSGFKPVWQGIAAAAPIMMGYFPIGFAFGVLAATAGLSIGRAAAMSVFVYAGSAQLISVGLIESGAGPLTLAMTVFLVNLRHLLMSAYLAPHLGKLKRWQQVLFSYELTDETFAVHSTHFRRHGTHPTAHLMALNISSHLVWVGSTLAGAWVCGRLPVDTRIFGLDYALPAMFIALLVLQLDNRNRIYIALLAAALSVTFYLAGLGHWHIILATLVAASVGAAADREQPKGAEKVH